MATRIISAAAGLAILAVVMVLPKEALGAAVFVVAVLGLHEFYGAMGKRGFNPFKPIGYVLCLPLLYIGVISEYIAPTGIISNLFSVKGLLLLLFIAVLAMSCLMVFLNERYKASDMSVTLFGAVYVAFLFSFLILTRNLDKGAYIIWFVFIGAWFTDTAAFFTGLSLGRKKILPAVSPKKSLEGCIGGVIGCIVAMTVFGLIINKYIGNIPAYHFIAMGLICGIVSQIGDWAASAVKRYAGIKDFGRLMPGHGGVLDRFDSIMPTAPAIYFYVTILLSFN